jgi:hypothetical protein
LAVVAALTILGFGLNTIPAEAAEGRQLVSIALTPPDQHIYCCIQDGLAAAFTAIGTYSDESTADLTRSVTWSTDDPSVATMSSSPSTYGYAFGRQWGKTMVRATLGSVQGSTWLYVDPMETRLTAQPAVAAVGPPAVFFPDLHAHLKEMPSGNSVYARDVSFFASHGKLICTARTDEHGDATCQGSVDLLTTPSLYYIARFAGDRTRSKSSHHGPLIRVLSISVT